jgi:hypothetical protein
MNLDFKDWFYTEAGTSTACVAVFSRPIFGDEIRRTWPNLITMNYDDEEKKKKRKTLEQKGLI